MRTAAKVAERKRERPAEYCPHPKCLWRTGGGFCPRHDESAKAVQRRADDLQAYRDGEGRHENIERPR